MGYIISLASGFSGEHMGLVFAGGEAHTDDAFLATRLQSKGYTVTAEKVADDEAASDSGEAAEGLPDFDKMTVDALKKYAEIHGIALGGAKTKAEIIAVISAAEAEQ